MIKVIETHVYFLIKIVACILLKKKLP